MTKSILFALLSLLLFPGLSKAESLNLSPFEMVSLVSQKQEALTDGFAYIFEDQVDDYVSLPLSPYSDDRSTTMGFILRHQLVERPGLRRLVVDVDFPASEAHLRLVDFFSKMGGYTISLSEEQRIAWVSSDELLKSGEWPISKTLVSSQMLMSRREFVHSLHVDYRLHDDLSRTDSSVFGKWETPDDFSLEKCVTIRDGLARLLYETKNSNRLYVLKPLQARRDERLLLSSSHWTIYPAQTRSKEQIFNDREELEKRMRAPETPLNWRTAKESGNRSTLR